MLAQQLRVRIGISPNEPVSMKTVLRQLNILAVYRPLSQTFYGYSQKASGDMRFILINSNSTRGRQHFSIAHELYHLFYDEAPVPHFCAGTEEKNPAERSADMFASAFLMPRTGIISKLTQEEITSQKIAIDSVLKLGQFYGVSHSTMVVRLKELKLISAETANNLMEIRVRREAALRGLDLSLYSKGNENLVIGDFGLKARQLFDEERISEGHYMELLNMIGYGESEDCARC